MARKNDILSIYTKEVEQIKADGLFKGEAPFVSPQGAKVVMEDGRELLNMCANNYLGLGDNQRLIDAAKKTYDEKGYCFCQIYLWNTGHPQKTGKEDFRISGNR
jgi:glycine C-acetyltransferase